MFNNANFMPRGSCKSAVDALTFRRSDFFEGESRFKSFLRCIEW
jgi:hypothetical protein